MVTFVAVCVHPGVGSTPTKHEISGSTTSGLRAAAWARCDMGRYVSRIDAIVDGGAPVTVYKERGGWLITDPTDETQIAALRPGG